MSPDWNLDIYIDREAFDIAPLMNKLEEDSKATIQSHNLIFEPLQETWLEADREKTGQMLINFITNAVKYAPVNSSIYVRCAAVGDMVQLSVKDEGPGISQDQLPRTFEQYYRVKGAGTAQIAVFGLAFI